MMLHERHKLGLWVFSGGEMKVNYWPLRKPQIVAAWFCRISHIGSSPQQHSYT